MVKAITMTLVIIVAIAVAAFFFFHNTQSRIERVSRFGEYRGYSAEVCDGYVRCSDYLSLSDGTKLAYDLLLPARDGIAEKNPLPVLFSYTTYLRAYNMVKDGKVVDNEILPLNPIKKAFIWLRAKLTEKGNIFDQAFMNKWVKRMLRHGYAVVVVEVRGTGASEGLMNPIFKFMAEDADDVLNWIATQSWSNGKIGMFGASSLAQAQYAAASTGNSHLKAIFPTSSSFDLYNAVVYPGGIFNTTFTKMFSIATGLLEKMAVPVESDKNGAILERILRDRRKTVTLSEGAAKSLEKAPYRDSESFFPKGDRYWEDLGLYTLLNQINKSNVAIYNATGWFDIFTRDATLWHNNLTGNRKLYIAPLSHYALKKKKGFDSGAEAHRWFDYWLKGIDNGIMDEPAVHYSVMDEPNNNLWRISREWPLRNERRTRFHFSPGSTENSGSKNKGLLTTEQPRATEGFDSYLINYSTTSGTKCRWSSILQEIDYPDMRPNDIKAVTYTTLPLENDIEVTGHPTVHLIFTTRAEDIDFFVYLEEVGSKGRSTYITEGCLRASNRSTCEAPFNNLGLPFHRGFKEDVKPLPSGEPVKIIFDLLPTSKLFRKGSRIRVSITCVDADNFKTPALNPAPEVNIFRNSVHASFIELPIIPRNRE
jgi:putative CocE/NonD family hydrolase